MHFGILDNSHDTPHTPSWDYYKGHSPLLMLENYHKGRHSCATYDSIRDQGWDAASDCDATNVLNTRIMILMKPIVTENLDDNALVL